MSVNRKKAAAAATNKMPPVVGQLTAPTIITDGVLAFGAIGGMVQLELGNSILVIKSDSSTEVQILCIAHLRMTPRVALNIQKALQGALDMHRENLNRMRAQQKQTGKRPPRPVKEEAEEQQEEAA